MEQESNEAGLAIGVLVLGGTLAFTGKLLVNNEATVLATAGLPTLVGLSVAAFGALVLTWWALSFCFAISAEVLARRGRLTAARRIGAFSPAFMRRAASLALGINLLAMPSAYADNSIPRAPCAVQHTYDAEDARVLGPQWVPVEPSQVTDPSWQPTAPPPSGSLLVKESRGTSQSSGPGAEVVVQPGDSLWSIALRHLGPAASDTEVAEAWPRWYAENKHVIGERPDLLQPGQILRPPATGPTDTK